MKRVFRIVLLLIVSLFIGISNVYAIDNGYEITSYDVNMIINEDNTFDITEKITVNFKEYRHGIFRKIPLRNDIVRNDGSTSTNKAKVTNISVSEHYSTSRYNNTLEIKIGDADKTLIGPHSYTIKYKYSLGDDPLKGKDEFYFNVIGNEWDTYISNVTFNIKFPKAFDESRLGFSVGQKGAIGYENLDFTFDGVSLIGKYNGTLEPYWGVTVRTDLDEGYFVVDHSLKLIDYVYFFVPVIAAIGAFFTWNKYGKNDPVVETVEFYPPEGLNSLDLAVAYKGYAENKDVTSLLIYLANKGYLKITETEESTLFGKKKDFVITKLKEYDGNDESERKFFNGLFNLSNKTDYTKILKIIKEYKQQGVKLSYKDAADLAEQANETNYNVSVTSKDLYDNFYVVMGKILTSKNEKKNRNIYIEKGSTKGTIITVLLLLATLLIIGVIPAISEGNGDLFVVPGILVFYIPFFAIGLFSNMPKGTKIIWLGFTTIHFSAMFGGFTAGFGLFDESKYIVGTLIGLICMVVIGIFIKLMPKRTKYGNDLLGKIKGFKTFLQTAEKDKLEALVEENPTYFYDILPYTYVLGVSEKWIKKFETISMQAPDWYDGYDTFNMHSFNSFMTRTMSSANTNMSSSPSSGGSGGGGGFSGGGSSGGGSGGGGGGSW